MTARGKLSAPAAAAASDLPRLSRPAQRALTAAGIGSLAQAARRTEAELRALHGFGPTGLETLRSALRAHGLSFVK